MLYRLILEELVVMMISRLNWKSSMLIAFFIVNVNRLMSQTFIKKKRYFDLDHNIFPFSVKG